MANTESNNAQQCKVGKATDLVIISLSKHGVQLLEEYSAGQKELAHQARSSSPQAASEIALLLFLKSNKFIAQP